MSNKTKRDYRLLVINDEQTDKPLWNVFFVGSFVNMTATVHANTETDAIAIAWDFLQDHYNFTPICFGASATEIEMVDYGTE